MKVLFNTLQILFLVIIMSGCSKDDKSATVRKVKYEVFGNYTGKVTIVYSTETGSFETITNVSLPWSKTVDINSSVSTATIGMSTTSTSTVGVQGQTATIKTLVNNVVKKNEMGMADANGRIQISNVVHYF
jgi:uncharacterized protein YceK